ncbi:LexA family transcriptional regulator [Halomonas sp. YJPS3-2]|nr:LexA family transcriptional regulator [Halomonas getboli]MCK2185714.1 LexA family transcriptional regulator [Halomonas getboli]
MRIGPVIRRLRHDQGRTLQQLCDAAGGRIAPAYLSRIERDEMAPSVYIVAAIAKALGTSIDTLLSEASGDAPPAAAGMPRATRMLVPVLQWQDAFRWVRDRNYGDMPTPIRWVFPPIMKEQLGYYGLELHDDSMQATEGLSFTRGGVIVVDQNHEAQVDDYVVIADEGGKGKPLFRQIISDGKDLFLRPRNPMYPIRPVTDGHVALGVVVGQVLDLTSGE